MRCSSGITLWGEKGLRWEIADPWILLTAAALATSRIRLGTAITPVARRRPAKLAREVATLDRLTGGRMVLGAGLGEPVADEYASFGDTTDIRVLAERLDEGLHALDLLWSGEPVTYRGNQITIDDVVFLPTPVQRPRVPIWVGGFWPNKAPMRRAARWDGATPAMAGMEAALDHKILCAAFRADRRWDTDERSADRRLLRRREVHDRRRACPPGLAALDADDDPLLARTVDAAGNEVEEQEEPEEPDLAWLSQHSWAWNPARLDFPIRWLSRPAARASRAHDPAR